MRRIHSLLICMVLIASMQSVRAEDMPLIEWGTFVPAETLAPDKSPTDNDQAAQKQQFAVEDSDELPHEPLIKMEFSTSSEQEALSNASILFTPGREEIMDSWEEIISHIDDGTARQRYAIGARKLVNLGETQWVSMQLAGFYLDERADGQGKAATTWIADTPLFDTYPLNPLDYTGGWAQCALRHFLNTTVWNGLPDELRNRMICVKKTQSVCDSSGCDDNQATEDYLWIPDYHEVLALHLSIQIYLPVWVPIISSYDGLLKIGGGYALPEA